MIITTDMAAIGLIDILSATFISKGAINLPLWPNSSIIPKVVD